MDIILEENKRQEFKSILIHLAENQDVCAQKPQRCAIYKRLEALYWSKPSLFRHYYSDIFEVLAMILNDTVSGNTDVLIQNLEIIYNGYKPQNKDADGDVIDIKQSLKKLCDHVNLDVARLSYIDASYRRANGDEERMEMNAVKAQITNLKEELIAANDSIRNQQREYITILGIFAAVILAFVGSFTFSTSIFSSMGNVQIYRHIITAALVGVVFFNIIYVLLDFIRRINTRRDFNIKDVSLSYIIFNAVMLLVIIFTILICWYYGVTVQ